MTDARAPGFFFDANEEEAAALLAMQTVIPGHPAAAAASGPPAAPAGGALATTAADGTAAFRPIHRPPMALLCVLFDGDPGGEIIPLRGDRYVIARAEGDIRIPHDPQISKKQHVELSRVPNDAGLIRWQVADLGSTNGTFVSVERLFLQPGTEVLVGRTRYRFVPAGPVTAAAAPPPPPVESMRTVLPGAGPVVRSAGGVRPPDPALVEVTPHDDGAKIPLMRNEYWIGRDPNQCEIVPTDDPFVSPKHAKVSKDANGRWQIQNNRSTNGLWIRLVKPLVVEKACRFQLGEQRFVLKVLI